MEPNGHKLDQALEESLEAVFAGEETVETVLARYPDLASELRPQLEAAVLFKSLQEEFEPDPEFVARSRDRLVKRIRRDQELKKAQQAAHPLERLRRLREMLLAWRPARPVWQAVAALVLAFGALLAVTGLVQAASHALPGDPIYPIKLALEQVELVVSPSDQNDARLALRNSHRRLKELQGLVAAQRYEKLSESLQQLEVQMSETVEKLGSVAVKDIGDAQAIAADLESSLSQETQDLEELAESAPQVKAQLDLAIAISIRGISAAKFVASQPPSGVAGGPPSGADAVGLLPGTPTPYPTLSVFAVSTRTLVPSSTPVPTATSTRTPTPTMTATSQPTWTPTFTETPKPTRPPATATPAPTDTETPTATWTPTFTPSPTLTPSATATNTPLPTATETPTSTATSTPLPTATDTPLPTATDTPPPTATDTPSPTATNTPKPTATNTPPPTATNTATPTATNTPRPTATPTTDATATPVPTDIPLFTPLASEGTPGVP